MISATKKILAEFGFYHGRKSYINSVASIIDETMSILSNDEVILASSIVFPKNNRWPPINQLKQKLSDAVDYVKKEHRAVEFYKKEHLSIRIRLVEWNELANLSRMEFARKFEGAKDTRGIFIEEIKELQFRYFDFVLLCYKHKDASMLRLVKETIVNMGVKKWKGKVTPKVCLYLLSNSKEDLATFKGKFNEEVIG